MDSFLLCLAMCECSYAILAPLYPIICGLRQAPVVQPPGTARFYSTTRLGLRVYFHVLYPRPCSRLPRLPSSISSLGLGLPHQVVRLLVTKLSGSSSCCWIGVRPPILARSSRRLLLSTMLTLQHSSPE